MPRIVLKDIETEKTLTVPDSEATIGRDPSCGFVVEGPKSKVVSSRHARIYFQDNAWWIEDTSRNGTILDAERLQVGQRHAIRVGQTIGLGESGPRYRIAALESKQVAATVLELPDLDSPPPSPRVEASTAPRSTAPSGFRPPAAAEEPTTRAMRVSEAVRAGVVKEEATEPMSPAPDWLVHIVVRATQTNQKFDVKAQTVKIGRSPECNIQIAPEQGASVSRVHTEIKLDDGGVTIVDRGSRNGTYVNGKR
ncbi:MAG TPA: FHA domain-containing protein, partial [Gemmatimonadaceae bacterium]